MKFKPLQSDIRNGELYPYVCFARFGAQLLVAQKDRIIRIQLEIQKVQALPLNSLQNVVAIEYDLNLISTIRPHERAINELNGWGLDINVILFRKIFDDYICRDYTYTELSRVHSRIVEKSTQPRRLRFDRLK